MYLQTITYAAYALAFLFIILLVRTFSNVTLKSIWITAQNQVKQKLRIKSEIEKAKERGEREFFFRNGTIRIFAKTQPSAIYKFKQFVLKEKAEKRKKLGTQKSK